MPLPNLCIQPTSSSSIKPTHNLERFLYEGGHKYPPDRAEKVIQSGRLGEPRIERYELLNNIVDELDSRIVSGSPQTSIDTYLSQIKLFLAFMDNEKRDYSLDSLKENFLDYAEQLFLKSNKLDPQITKRSAYHSAGCVSSLLCGALEVPYANAWIKETRLNPERTIKKAVTTASEKQNLEETFAFGSFIVDMINGLTPEAIMGPLPLVIPIREGLVKNNQVVLNAGLSNISTTSLHLADLPSKKKHNMKHALMRRNPVNTIDNLSSGRWYLVNMRVALEFMLFMGQTGMNYTQVLLLENDSLKYSAIGDSWNIRSYKRRRGGDVYFSVFKSYKHYLTKYRRFINTFFPDTKYLFPQWSNGSESSIRSSLDGRLVRRLTARHDIPWINLRQLRNTRINWLLRRSGDEDLTAEMAQHSKEVLRDQYEKPSQQRAAVEVTNFWNEHDPIKKNQIIGSVIGSECDGNPKPVIDIPDSVATPDCVTPAGCLWCKHRRDIFSADYVWLLASFKFLKTLEVSLLKMEPGTSPAETAIGRLEEMIEYFGRFNDESAKWVKEAELKILEGSYHPNWQPMIEAQEII